MLFIVRMIGIYQKNDVEQFANVRSVNMCGKSKANTAMRCADRDLYVQGLRALRAWNGKYKGRAKRCLGTDFQCWLFEALERDRIDYLTLEFSPAHALDMTIAKAILYNFASDIPLKVAKKP